MKYFINFVKKINSVHKTQTAINLFSGFRNIPVFGCPKVACSRDSARDFFGYSPVNNALSHSSADARETV